MHKLYMLLLGSTPKGRHIEQHDVFFTIATSIKEVLPQAAAFWPEAKSSLHLDGWRCVSSVNGYNISIVPKSPAAVSQNQLFFINLGGYKPGEFEEFHYKMLAVAPGKAEAIKQSKATAFYKHTGFKGANSHVDDKYGIDVDDFFAIQDILPASVKDQFTIIVSEGATAAEDELHLGYFIPSKVDRWGAGY